MNYLILHPGTPPITERTVIKAHSNCNGPAIVGTVRQIIDEQLTGVHGDFLRIEFAQNGIRTIATIFRAGFFPEDFDVVQIDGQDV